MLVHEKTALLFEILFEHEKPVTTLELSQVLGISPRSVHTRIKEAKEIAQRADIAIVNTPGVGVSLDTGGQNRENIRRAISLQVDEPSSFYARREVILDILFTNETACTMQFLAEDLEVSKSVITRDITRIERWLKKFGISLYKRRNKGIVAVGTEQDIRKAILAHHRAQTIHCFCESRMAHDYRISPETQERLCHVYGERETSLLQNILTKADQNLGEWFDGESYLHVLEYLHIMIQRVHLGKCLPTVSIPKDFPKNILETVGALGRDIERDLADCIPQQELNYIALCFLCLGKMSSDHASFMQIEAPIKLIARDVLAAIEETLNIPLNQHDLLGRSMVHCIEHICLCRQFDVAFGEGLHKELKRNHSDVLAACVSASMLLEKSGIAVFDEDIAHMAKMVLGALADLSYIPMVFVTAEDHFTVQYMTGRIQKLFPQIQLSDSISYQEWKSRTVPFDQPILTTVFLPKAWPNLITISPWMDDQDIGRIKQFLKEYQKQKEKENAALPLDGFPVDVIAIDCDCTDKPDALGKGYRVLYENGNVNRFFLEDLFQREAFSSTAIGSGVAIPHGFHEHVHKTGVCIVRMKKGINWTEEDRVNLVFILAVRVDEFEKNKAFFQNFYRIIKDESYLRQIRKAENPNEIIGMVFQTKE